MPGGRTLKTRLISAAVLAFLAVAIPPTDTTVWLVGANVERLGSVLTGLWLFKLMLGVHAGLLAASTHLWWHQHSGQYLMSADPARPLGPPTHTVAYLMLILLVATALRFYALDEGLWIDEIDTLTAYVRHPALEIATTFYSENQHMLYSLSARATHVLFGESSWSLRLPAVAFGVASLAATWWFGMQVTTRAEALLSTAMLSLSYHHVWFSQNARGYTGLLFWTLLASVLWLKLLRGDTSRPGPTMLGYGICIALATYTHATGALVAVVHCAIWAALVWSAPGDRRAVEIWRPAVAVLLSGTLTLQLYAVVLPQFVDTILVDEGPRTEYVWKNPFWLLTETARGLSQGIPGGLFAVGAGVAVFALGLASYARQSLTLVVMMVLPATMLVAILMALQHNLWPRMLFFSAGFGALIVVRGLATAVSVLGGRWRTTAARAGAMSLVVGIALTVPRAFGPKQDFPGARDAVLGQARSGDAVVTVNLTTMPFRDYLGLDWKHVESLAELHEIERSHPRTYLLYTLPSQLESDKPALWQHLQRDYQMVDKRSGSVRGGAIVIMRR